MGTAVERKPRSLILSKMRGCPAETALEGITRQIKLLPAVLRRSMACELRREMACQPELARRLEIDIWFCDLHAPCQRGSNENTNALLRQFFPKGTDLSGIRQIELNGLARLMNQRPRKTLGWKTPEEAMDENLAAFRSTFGLDSWVPQVELARHINRSGCEHQTP